MKYARPFLIFICSLLGALHTSHSFANDTPTRYSLDAKLSDDHAMLDVKVIVATPTTNGDALNFMLNRHADIKAITQNGNPANYTFKLEEAAPSIYVEESRLLSVGINETSSANTTLSISYSVPLSAVNALVPYQADTKDIELNGYSAWFPLREDFGTFQFEAVFDFPETFKLYGNGTVERTTNIWTIANDNEGFDIVLFASDELDTLSFKAGQSEISVTHLGADALVIEQLSSDIPQMLTNFTEWFGPLGEGASSYHFVITPRPRGTSYSRGNFAVMTDVKPDEYDFLYRIAGHEIGHFWWNKADSSDWQDWLNEGFAEYAALAAYSGKFGAVKAKEIWQKEAKRYSDLPAIKGLKRSHKDAQKVLYRKAAYLLHALSLKKDKAAFHTLLQNTHASSVSNTQQLLSLIQSNYGNETRSWFNEKLAE